MMSSSDNENENEEGFQAADLNSMESVDPKVVEEQEKEREKEKTKEHIDNFKSLYSKTNNEKESNGFDSMVASKKETSFSAMYSRFDDEKEEEPEPEEPSEEEVLQEEEPEGEEPEPPDFEEFRIFFPFMKLYPHTNIAIVTTARIPILTSCLIFIMRVLIYL